MFDPENILMEFSEHLRRRGIGKGTVYSYVGRARGFLQWASVRLGSAMSPDALNQDLVNEYLLHVSKTTDLSFETISGMRSALRSLLRFLSHRAGKRVEEDQGQDLQPPGMSRSSIDEALHHLMKAVREGGNPLHVAVVSLAVQAGLAPDEIRKIRLEDITLLDDHGYVVISRPDGGTSSIRVLLNGDTCRAIREWMSVRPGKGEGWLFITRRGWISSSYVRHIIMKYVRAAGLNIPNVYAIRKLVAIRNMAGPGRDPEQAIRLLGPRLVMSAHRFSIPHDAGPGSSEISRDAVTCIERFLAHIRQNKGSWFTILSYRSHLLSFVRWFEKDKGCPFHPQDVRPEDIIRYIRYLQEDTGAVAGAINHTHSALRSFFRFLIREGVIRENPADDVPRARKERIYPKILSDQELSRLLQAADSCASPMERAIVLILARTGIGLTDLLSLRTDDMIFDGEKPFIRIRGGPAAERTIPIDGKTFVAIREWLSVRPSTPDRRLFVTESGPVRRHHVLGILDRVSAIAGIPRVTPRLLRNTRAVHLLRESGGDIASAATLLGVSMKEIIRKYYPIAIVRSDQQSSAEDPH